MKATANGLAIVGQIRAAIVATGWSETSRRTGLDRTTIWRAFREDAAMCGRNFGTVCLVAEKLGFEIALVRPS